jgi:hypothetical protein
MKRVLISAALVALSASSFAATCTSTSTWTTLGPPGFQNFGQTFGAAGSYTDCYTFNLSSAANAGGTTTELNFLFDKLSIDVTNVSLFTGSTIGGSLVSSDNTAGSFGFSNLAGGTYTLAVSSLVDTNAFSFYTKAVGYTGQIITMASGPVASAVPEGDAYGMSLAGLLGVGGVAMIRRRLRG